MLNLLILINILIVYLTIDYGAAQITILTLEGLFGTLFHNLTYSST